MAADNRTKLYNALKSEGYTDIGSSQEEFNGLIENPKNLRLVYDALKTSGYTDIGKDYAEFEGLINPHYNPIAAQNPQAFAPEGEEIKPEQIVNGNIPTLKDTNRFQVSELSSRIEGLTAKRNKEIEEENRRAEEATPWYARAMKNMARGGIGGAPTYAVTNDGRLNDDEYMTLQAAAKSMRNAQNIIAEADHNAKEGSFADWLERSFAGGAVRGLGKTLYDPHTWDMGVLDVAENSALLKALDAYEAGNSLTEAQQALLDAKAVELATNAYFGSEVGRGYKAGQVTAEAIPFMLEMAINPASTAGKGAVNALTRYALKRFGTKAAKKGVSTAAKVATRVAGDVAGASAMAATTGAGNVAANTLERMAGDARFATDAAGRSSFAGTTNRENPAIALAKSFGATTIENYSEMLGEYFAPVFTPIGKGLAKGLDKMKLSAVNRFIDDVKMSDIGRFVSDFEKQTQWSGVAGEYSEEVVGGVINALTVGDQTLDTDENTGVFNLEKNIETLTSVALMGGFMSSVKTLGYRTPVYRAQKQIDYADNAGQKMFEDWGDIKNKLDNDRSSLPFILMGANPEQRKVILDYYAALCNYNGVLRGKAKQEAEGDNTVNNSYDAGYATTDAQGMASIKKTMEDARAAVSFLSDEAVQRLDENPVPTLELMESEGATDEELQAVRDYVNASAAYKGMMQHLNEEADEQTRGEQERLTAISNEEGMVQPVVLDNDTRAYVQKGTLDDEHIVVVDDNGVQSMVAPSTLRGVENPYNAQESIQTMRDEYVNARLAELDNLAQQTTQPVAAQYNYNDEVTILDDNNQPVRATIASNADGDGRMQVETETPVNGKRVNYLTAEEINGRLYEAPGELVTLNDGQNEFRAKVVNDLGNGTIEIQREGENKIDVVPASWQQAQQAEQSAPKKEPIPMEKVGKEERPAYHLVPIERTLEELHGDADLTQQDIDAFITANITELQGEIKKVAEKEPKMGANIAKFKQDKIQWAEKQKALQAKLDYYTELQKHNAELNSSELQEAYNAPGSVEGVTTPDEVVAGLLGSIKITPESFKRETGLSTTEQKGLVGIIANEDKGGVSVERAAEIIAENYSDELAASGYTGDVQGIRNMLISVLSDGNPRTYAKRGAEQRANEEAENRRREIEAWVAQFDMTVEEYFLYEQTMLPRVMRDYQGFDENEYYSILADEYNNSNYDTERESESVGRGREVLQGEQPVPARGAEPVGAGNEGGAVPSDVQGGTANGVAQEEIGQPVGISEQLENGGQNALQNGANELNLQQENEQNNVDETNISRGGQVSQSVPQGEHRTQTPQIGGMEETAARLGERIEADGGTPQSGLSRDVREIENRVTREYAQENGLWIPFNDVFKLGRPSKSGNEHDTYVDTENQVIYKVNNRMNTPSIVDLLNRMALHNKYFPESKYSLVGFTAISNNGDVWPVFAQDYVPGARVATNEEIDAYMSALGFTPVGEARYTNGEIVVKDLRPRNVLVDADGDIYVVDAEFEPAKQESGENRTNSTENAQEPRYEEEILDNGDKRITNYNSRGEVTTIAFERDGKIVQVDSFEDGALFEHTEYDENGKSTSVTRFDKEGNVVAQQAFESSSETPNDSTVSQDSEQVGEQENATAKLSFSKLKDLFNSLNEDEYLAVLFDRVIKVAEKANINIILKPLRHNIGGNYRAATNTVYLNSDFLFHDTYDGIKQEKSKKASTIVHELIHSVTAYAVTYDYLQRLFPAVKRNSEYQEFEKVLPENLKRAAAELYNIFDEVRTLAKGKRAEYGTLVGLDNPMEFIAEISVKPFREKLKKTGLWKRIIDGIKKFFRVANDETNKTNALKESEAILEHLLSNFDLVAHKSFIDFDKKITRAELQQGDLSIERENPAFKKATERTVEQLKKVAPVEIATEEQARAMGVFGFSTTKEEFKARAQAAKEQAGIVAYGLNGQELPITQVEKHSFTGNLKNARQEAKSWAENNFVGKEYDMPEGGGKYIITKRAIGKYIDKTAVEKSENPGVHLSALVKLPEIISNSVDAEIHPDYNRGEDGIRRRENGIGNEDMLVHRLYGAIEIDGKVYRVKTTMHEFLNSNDANSPHSYEVTQIELIEDSTVAPTNEAHNPLNRSTNSISATKLLNGVEKSYDKGKKLLDESKDAPEMMTVYHGSGAKFDRFDHSFMGTGEGAQAFGWGTYVTEVEGIGKQYANATSKPNLTYKGQEVDVEGFENPWRIINDLYEDTRGKLSEMRAKAERYEGLAEEDSLMKPVWKEVVRILKEARRGDLKVSPRRVLYTVEIPDDNGSNYLHWEEVVPPNVVNAVKQRLFDELAKGDYKGVEKELKRELDDVFKYSDNEGYSLYGNISAYLGGGKAASRFLNEMGFVGISYPADGGRAGNKKNYVIFNESDARITDRVEFFRTANGTVYGWAVNGKVYLTPDGINPNTPVHEYTHLWASVMEKNNPEEWAKIVEGLKASPVWNEVLADEGYRDIWNNDNRVASEVLSRLAGRENYRREMERAQREIDNATDPIEAAERITFRESVKQAVQRFWDNVKRLFQKITGKAGEGSWKDFVEMPLRDFWAGVKPEATGSPLDKMFIGEQGAANLDKAQEATTRLDNLAVAREMEAAGKEAKVIKLATGWERGADGKWRYEVEDALIKETPMQKVTRLKEEYKPIEKEFDRLNNATAVPLRRGASEAEKSRRKELNKQRAKVAKEWSKKRGEIWGAEQTARGLTVAELIGEDNELLKMYPELTDMQVSFVNNTDFIERGYNGFYDGSSIWINPNAENANRVFTHEIQHAIQEIEGFAKGSNVERFADVRGAVLDSLNFMTNGDLLKGSAISDVQSLRDALDKNIPYTEVSVKEGYAENLQKVANKYGYENIDALVEDFANMPSAFEQYRRTAGEVESRNVQARMDMTAEERRNTLAAETEDVARKDQVFIYENLGENAMGTNVVKRRGNIASHFAGKNLTGEQKNLISAFEGTKNDVSLDVIDNNGQHHHIAMKQGNENKAGIAHSILHHFETISNNYTADEILLIPDIVKNGTQKKNGNKIAYEYSVNGVTYTVTTVIKNRNEEFTNFFTDRKPAVKRPLNTASQHGTSSQPESANKGSTNSSNTQERDVLNREGTPATEEFINATVVASNWGNTHKGAAPCIVIQSAETLRAQLEQAGFSAEDIADAEKIMNNGATGGYNPNADKVVIFKNDLSKKELRLTLWHENAHRAIEKLYTQEEIERVFKAIVGEYEQEVREVLAKIGYEVEDQAEEFLVQAFEHLLYDAKTRVMLEGGKFKVGEGATDESKILAEFIKPIIKFINNGGERGYNPDGGIRESDRENQGGYVGQHQESLEVRNAGNKSGDTRTGIKARRGTGDPVIHERALAQRNYEERVKSGMFQSQEALQDSMLSLKVAMQEIVGKDVYIEDIAGFENAYLGENRLSSVNKAEADAFAHTLFKPMLDEVAKLAKTEQEREALTDYMMAKHGIERNAYMREEAAKSGDKKANQRDYAGLTALTNTDNVAEAESKAQEMVEAYEQSHDTTALWEKVNAVSKAILQKSYECGMMNKETFEKVSGMYEFYIPLRGFDEKTSAEAYAYLTNKNGAFNAPIRKAEGRSSKADDPFANLQSMAESAIMQGNRNKLVKQRFLNFVLNHPSDLVSVSDLWIKYDDVADEWAPVFPDNIDSDAPAAEVERKMREFEARMERLAEEQPDRYKKGKDAVNIPYRAVTADDLHQHQIVVKRGGKDIVLTVNGNPRLAQAVNGQTNPDNDISGAIGSILKAGEYINRKLSAVYTTRNPDFIVSNFMRDLLYANSMAWVKEGRNYALRFHRNQGLIANPVNMKRLFAKLRKGELNMNDKTEAMFYEFIMNGGETGYSNIRDIEQHKNDIRKEIKKYNGQIPATKAMEWLGERLDEYNRAIENSARFAAFVTSREMGRSIDRAIYDAKEISVNFNKKGSGAKFYDKRGQTFMGDASAFVSGLGRTGFIFWNAAIQGTTNFGRQLKRHPAKAFTASAVMFALGAIIAALGSDDDEDKSAYYNLPEYVRRSNIMFRAGDSWISIPLPVEYRAMYGMGELMVSMISGKEEYNNAGEIASAIAGQLSQILPIDFMEGAGGLSAFVPSAAKPFVESYITEKSWTGLPLYKDTPYNKDMPEWTKAYKSANKYLVNLAEVLNEATGGDKYTKGAIDINPAKLENLLEGYFGGFASMIDKATKMAETVAGDREYDPRNFLLINRLVKAGDERTEYRAVNNKYFRLRDEYENTKRRLRNYERDTDMGVFDYAEKIDFLYNSPEYARFEIFEGYRRDINYLYKALKEATELNDEREIKELEAELNELKKEMIKEMDTVR